MAGSRDGHRERSRTPSQSPDRSPGRRRDDRNKEPRSSRRRGDDRESSRKESPRRRSSRSRSRDRMARDDPGRRRRERRERSTSSADERRRKRSHRSHRHRDDRDRDGERSSRRHRSPRLRSRSPRPSRSPQRALQRSGPLPSQSDAFTGELVQSGDAPPPEKQKPNYKNSGRLAAETNTVQVESGEGIVLKYHEPPEARKPPAKEPWRLYVFKGDDLIEMVELSERSCWLIGRERAVVDFPLDHPSCSKQHAALQFRYVEKRNEYGDRIGKVKPYLLDLESSNGSTVNKEPIPAGRYVEVMDKDVLGFGTSTREYVLMLPK